jgi:hypothetical protein
VATDTELEQRVVQLDERVRKRPRKSLISGDPSEDKITSLAELTDLAYQRRRKEAASELGGMPVGALDKLRKKRQREMELEQEQDAALPHWKVEPWPEPIDGAVLLDSLRRQFSRYVVLPQHTDVALALWTLFSWGFEHFDIAPYLTITSPTRRCGKTVLMTLLYWLTCRGKKSDSMSKAAIYRSVDEERPTLILDEVSWVLDPKDDRQGILCGGFERNGYVEVCEGDSADIKRRRFSTFCPKAFGLIGKLVGTLTDRSICILLRRKLRTEKVERLRRRDNDEFAQLRQWCRKWADDNAEALAAAPQMVDDKLNDRALDFWEPLFIVAEKAGGSWPELARQAAYALNGVEDDGSINVELLKDIGLAFGAAREIRSDPLIEKLCADPERPWKEYKRGKALTQKQLAGLLKDFRIISVNVRPPGEPQGKGYRRADFESAWEAYCPGKFVALTDFDVSIRPSVPRPVESAQVDGFASVPEPPWDGSKNDKLSYSHAGLDGWTDGKAKTPYDHVCAHCGRGDPPPNEVAIDGCAVWLHRDCEAGWMAARDNPES